MFDLFASILTAIEHQYDSSVRDAAIDAMQAIAARHPDCLSMQATIGVIRAGSHADVEYWEEFYRLAWEKFTNV